METITLFPPQDKMTFAHALKIELAALQAEYPKFADRLSQANAILTAGRLFVEDSGAEGMVTSADTMDETTGTPAVYHVNGSCSCPAGQHQKHCKHKAALYLYQRVIERLTTPPPPPPKTTPQRSWFVQIHGVEAIRFEGLRTLAEDAGLRSLVTIVITATPDFAVCQSTATFADGRVFTDIGDATPDNVAAKGLRPHFVRIAATRAAARALRRALNISQVAVDELGQEALEAEREAA
jgi:hypothetical protein